MTVWFALGEWEYQEADEAMASLNEDARLVQIPKAALIRGLTYRFRISAGGVHSNEVTLQSDDLGALLPDGSGGDRDGADRDEQEMPGLYQPVLPPVLLESRRGEEAEMEKLTAETPVEEGNREGDAPDSPIPETGGAGLESDPEYDKLNSIQGGEDGGEPVGKTLEPEANALEPEGAGRPVPEYEWSTAAQTALSGMRLRELMAANPDVLRFEKQGISLALPTGFFEELEWTNSSLLLVDIEPVGEAGFRLVLTLDGADLSSLPDGTLVQLPYAPQENERELICREEETGRAALAQYDGVQGIVTASVTCTGTYQITGTDAPRNIPTSTPLPGEFVRTQRGGDRRKLVLIVGAGMLSGGTLILRGRLSRRKGRR